MQGEIKVPQEICFVDILPQVLLRRGGILSNVPHVCGGVLRIIQEILLPVSQWNDLQPGGLCLRVVVSDYYQDESRGCHCLRRCLCHYICHCLCYCICICLFCCLFLCLCRCLYCCLCRCLFCLRTNFRNFVALESSKFAISQKFPESHEIH